MDMSREERLADLEKTFSQMEVNSVDSPEELARAETARAARHFGFAQPVFRTSVKLHLSGEGIQNHDVDGGLAGAVIAGFSGAVNAAASQLKMAPGSTDLYLSPTVTAGSVILELFGAPTASAERLDTEINDTPVDGALARLFTILNNVAKEAENPSPNLAPIEGALGKRLFRLVKDLLDSNVDLDVSWTRPRGSTTSTSLSRSTSRVLKRVLDTENMESSERRESGILTSISTAGVIGFIVDGRKTTISIAAPDFDVEFVRGLWAKRVEVTWLETVISHPQREEKKIKHELISVHELKQDQ